MRRALITMMAVAAIAATALPAAAAAPEAEYRVTVYNLTGGQPFTPPLAVTHRPAVDLFEPGAPASTAIQEIAENGNLAPAIALAAGSRHVAGSIVADGGATPPVVMPGSARSFTITASTGATRLSVVAMLVCTHDGFTGGDSLRLPSQVGDSTVRYASASDAGTEVTSEAWADLVPPCAHLTGFGDQGGTGTSNPALAEDGVIRMHPGITGSDDLVPSVHGWTGPAAKIVVTRTR